ncbi:TPA: glycosyltransferase family 4 protein [Serratia marcescens]|uniref:glycosyltransferase family 4 protein n=1 Tax=Serratia TaxID=613 RepID=UPI0018D5F833|nr:glycosyltransferase family 4 protein [Serratia marcescens]MBH2667307.1 glycosyltransferase family 4 protein [Serratia marcescens]MBH2672289.1 glycosyltransferase family 4 protein [Serratia marcescens]MDP8798006.1 glycosyltransferase family 4 protein [Serratia marcescens]MEB5609909.1 glycosyltransferase family 4 protein [Serratia marcescens]HAT2867925.1 glycosyltransferase family 4 protein [Serratia marcescens]
MKVMVANTLYAPHRVGGAEISVQILCESLVALGHQVRALTFHAEPYRKCSIINGVEVVYLPLKNIYWPFDNKKRSSLQRGLWHIIDSYNLASYLQFCNELDMYRPDLVHTNNLAGFSVAVWGAAKKRGVKILHTARDYYLFHPNSTLFKQGSNQDPRSYGVWIWSLFRRFHSKKVNTFVGISDFIKEFHLANGFFPRALKRRIYNAVAIDPVSDDTECTEPLRIGFIGKLSAAKGFDIFCQFAQAIKAENENVMAIAAGDYADEEKRHLAALASAAQVNVLGRLDLPAFLAKVDIVILPTKWREPFGRTVIECALANKVVLVSSVGGITEMLDIAPTISELTGTPTYEKLLAMKKESRAVSPSVREVFSPETITQEYIAEYDRVKNGY